MSRLLRTAGRAAVASSVHGRVQRRQRQRWAEAAPAPAPAAPLPAPAPATDVDAQLTQLTQLGQLRDAGVLTDAEFELKKATILGR